MAVKGQGENSPELAVGPPDASSAEPSDAAHRLSPLLRGALIHIHFWDNFGPGQFYCRSCCSILLATMRPGNARCPSDAPIAEVRCRPRHPDHVLGAVAVPSTESEPPLRKTDLRADHLTP